MLVPGLMLMLILIVMLVFVLVFSANQSYKTLCAVHEAKT